MPNAATALPVVTSVADQQRNLLGSQAADTVDASMTIIREDDDVAAKVGAAPDRIVQQLARVFAQYEVPMGLVNKLLGLVDFSAMEMLVDDSGSMASATDSNGPDGRPLTRWQEAQQRLGQMLQILVYVPAPPLFIRFLNRADVIELRRNAHELPEQFLQRAVGVIAQVWRRGPDGSTPVRERIAESLARFPGQAVLRYLFCDGEPDGGHADARAITLMLINRPNPKQNPFTFLSCTNEDANVEWCKEAEEAAPYCSEFDDYGDEAAEVLKDQGKSFPYTFGMHLVAQLVAAFNPDDLDAMDESVPFAKMTLDNLQGYQCSPNEYQYYFENFLAAQAAQPTRTALDRLKKEHLSVWRQNFPAFVAAPLARQIPAVQQYLQRVVAVKRSGA
jgi:hypothetical protein